MLQDILPHVYQNQFTAREASPDDIVWIFRENGAALLSAQDGIITWARIRDIPGLFPARCRSLFAIDGQWHSMLCAEKFEAPDGFSWYLPGEYRRFRPMERLFPCVAAASCCRWYRDNRFCGRCGAEMTDSKVERARVCPRCGQTVYPKICPAVIVAVRNGERLLLTKYAGRDRYRKLALIAGFNEIGETIEETVHREVLEEVGVRVKNLQFYKSQPWLFSDSLLMGFFCDLDGDDHITLQESELSVGIWVDRADVPENTEKISLTGEMMEQFRCGLA